MSRPTPSRLRIVSLALTLASAALPLLARSDEPVRYRLDLSGRAHHELRVTATFRDVGRKALDLRMSRTSPGRYRMHEFAKNLYGLEARDGLGDRLAVEGQTPSSWRIGGHDGTVEVTYTIFADLLSGTYSSIDTQGALINPPSVFVWARGQEERPVEVQLDLPLGWSIVSQLPFGTDETKLQAKDLAFFFDSPIGLGTFDVREWRVDSVGRLLEMTSNESGAEVGGFDEDAGAEKNAERAEAAPGEDRSSDRGQIIRLAVHHEGEADLVDRLEEDLAALVAEAAAVFGELPRFDHGRYSFICNYLPYAHDDGMEHRNSTVHSSSAPLSTARSALVRTLTHEFFHVWNVERLRPASLEPFDFEELNRSEELWFAEGFTSYYDGLLMVRAGLLDEATFRREWQRKIEDFQQSPARRFGGAAYMSSRAAFNDRASWVDPRTVVNTYLHYYAYGEALALALDLELRARFGTDLDTLMRSLWSAHGRSETPYALSDLERHLADLTSENHARDFFERFVETGESPAYGLLLNEVGWTLERLDPEAPWLGSARLAVDSNGVYLADDTRFGSPLYRAGLGKGDRLLELAGRELDTPADVERALRRRQPGESLRLIAERRLEWLSLEIVLGADPSLEIGIAAATEEQTARRTGWLSSQVESSAGSSSTDTTSNEAAAAAADG